MAKSAAPFLSINPSGSVAGLLTASRWKGRPYLRLLVTPSNPRTSGQVEVRNILGAIAKSARAVLTSFVDSLHVGSPFFVAARDMAPSGQSWISWYQKSEYSRFAASLTAYAALTGTIKGYFANTAADIGLVNYTGAPGGGDAISAAQQLYLLADFASAYLPGAVATLADLAIAGANQGAVDNFGDAVHVTA